MNKLFCDELGAMSWEQWTMSCGRYVLKAHYPINPNKAEGRSLG